MKKKDLLNEISLEALAEAKEKIAEQEKTKPVEKLSKHDWLLIVTVFSVGVTFAVLWYSSKSLTELSDMFMVTATLFFLLFASAGIALFLNLRSKKTKKRNYIYAGAVLIFVFSLMLFRLDYMCEVIRTNQVAFDYVAAAEAIDSADTEAWNELYEAYKELLFDPRQNAEKIFYIKMLVMTVVCAVIALVTWLVVKKKDKNLLPVEVQETEKNTDETNVENVEADIENDAQ